MPEDSMTLTILFADISGSTALYETLGNEKAHSLVEECLSLLAISARLHDGEVIKTMGDGIMCSFRHAENAAQAAIAMNQTLGQSSAGFPEHHSMPDIKTGFHTGEVIIEEADIFGDAVNVASRMVSLAKARQIITTSATAELLPKAMKDKTRFVDRTTIKGKSGEFDIYELSWEEGNQTIIVSALPSRADYECQMNVATIDRSVVVDSSKPSVSIGRHEHNDITVNDARVSRTHCRIEYRKGKFVFIDQSSNGSYIHNEGGYTAFVHNDESVLGDSGFISLGHDISQNSRLSIFYRIKRQ
jgi:class 3 adenylate cyclase